MDIVYSRYGGHMRIKILIAASFMMHFSLYSEESTFMIELEAKDALTRSKIASYISIDSIIGDRVYSVVNSFDLNNLRTTDLEILTLEVLNDEKVSSYFESFFSDVDADPEFPRGDEAFHTFKEIETELKQLADAHSGIAQVFSIGKSVEGRDIWALRISDGSDTKPGIAYLGTHHAREHVSTEIPFMFAKELLDRSINDNEIKDLLKNTEIFIIPLVNPDGATFDITNKRYKYWRKNRKANNGGSFGVDLNRNYGYGWGTGGSSSNPRSDIYMGKAPFSEPETQSVKDFFLAHKNITTALTFHTYSELILYPWGGKDDPVPGKDGEIFRKMANDMARMNHYTPEQASDLYIASGDTCDWLYGELSVYCFTFELSPSSEGRGGFYPGASIIPKVYRDNLEPMLYLLRFAGNPASVLE